MAEIKVYLAAVYNNVKEEWELYLTDSEGNTGINDITTMVNPGDTVIWETGKSSNIKKIQKVYSKKDSGKFYKVKPEKKKKKVWQAVVADDAAWDSKDAYNIKYQAADGSVVIDDPTIQVYPPPPQP